MPLKQHRHILLSWILRQIRIWCCLKLCALFSEWSRRLFFPHCYTTLVLATTTTEQLINFLRPTHEYFCRFDFCDSMRNFWNSLYFQILVCTQSMFSFFNFTLSDALVIHTICSLFWFLKNMPINWIITIVQTVRMENW